MAEETYEELKAQIDELKQKMQLIYSDELESTLKANEQSGDFIEAKRTYVEMKDCKTELKSLEQQALQTRHLTEREEIESLHLRDFQMFNQNWNNRFQAFRESCQSGEEELRSKQTEQLSSERKRLEEKIPVIPKHSSEYFNLERIQNTLVRQRKQVLLSYDEAHYIQQQIKNLDAKEKFKWEQTRQRKIDKQLEHIQKRHEQELANLKMRQKNGLQELKQQRAKELDSLIRHYKNLKKEAMTVQKLEQSVFDGKVKTQAGKKLEQSAISNLISSASQSSFAERLLSHDLDANGKSRDGSSPGSKSQRSRPTLKPKKAPKGKKRREEEEEEEEDEVSEGAE